jgi:hypothetical protein
MSADASVLTGAAEAARAAILDALDAAKALETEGELKPAAGIVLQGALYHALGAADEARRLARETPMPPAAAWRLEEHARLFHAGCGGIVVGPLDDLVCAECGKPMTAFLSPAEVDELQDRRAGAWSGSAAAGNGGAR